jgi:hypothetical protein
MTRAKDKTDIKLDDKDETVESVDKAVELFSDLFDDDTKNIIVRIYRTHPKFWDSKDITGFLGTLTPGDSIESIQNRFGGGTYHIQKLINNRIVDNKYLKVAGIPTVENPVRPKDAGTLSDHNPLTSLEGAPDSANYKGIPLTGSDDRFMAMLERIKIIERAFPEKTDINDVLLELAVKNNNNGGLESMLSLVGKLGEVVDRFSGNGGSGGANLYDLGSKLIDGVTRSFEAIAQAKKNNAGITQPRPVKTAPSIEYNPGSVPGNIPENNRKNEDINSDMSQPSQPSIPEKACIYIVNGFLDDPRQSPEAVLDILKTVLPEFDEKGLKQIAANKSIFINIAHSVLYSTVDSEDIDKAEFDKYFDTVFDLFVKGEPNNI